MIGKGITSNVNKATPRALFLVFLLNLRMEKTWMQKLRGDVQCNAPRNEWMVKKRPHAVVRHIIKFQSLELE